MRTRPVPRTRQVEHTVNGIPRTIDEEYTEHVPVLPRDWDHIILTAATAGAALFLAAGVGWTTASIGDLLDKVAPSWVAYGVAGGFDLAWIICLGLWYVARYDDARAAGPRTAGNWFLPIAMAAVGVHGWQAGDWAVGVFGAAVPGLAKGLWTVVMRFHAAPLNSRTRAWLAQEDAELGVQLALAGRRRQVLRTQGQIAALTLSAPDTGTGTDPDTAVRDAVQSAPDTMHGADPQAIAAYLAEHGIRVTPDAPDTPAPDKDTRRSDAVVRDIRPDKSGAIVDTIRALLRDGIRDRDEVTATVRATHGQHVARDTVIKTLRRLDPTA